MMEENDNPFKKMADDLNLNNVLEQYGIKLKNPNIKEINDAIQIMETQNQTKQNTEMPKIIDNLHKFKENVIMSDKYNKDRIVALKADGTVARKDGVKYYNLDQSEVLERIRELNKYMQTTFTSEESATKILGDLKEIKELKNKLSKNEVEEIESNTAYSNMKKLMKIRMLPLEEQNILNPIKSQNALNQDIGNFDSNSLKKVGTPILPKPGNVNLESESMIRRAFGIGSQNVGDLKELLNITKEFYTFKPDTLKNFNDIIDNKAKNLSQEQLSKAIQELKTAKKDIEDKQPDFQSKYQANKDNMVLKRLDQMTLKMEELRYRPVIKELEIAKSKMNTWNRLFDKKTYNEAKKTLNSKENLNKLGEYAEKISSDENMSPEVKDKLMGKIGDLVKGMEKNIDSKINRDQKEIGKQERETEKYGKEIEKLNEKLLDRKDKTANRQDDIKTIGEKVETINNPKIQNAINELSKKNLNKLESSRDKETKLQDQKNEVSLKHELSGINKGVLKEKVENRQEIKVAVEGVGKHVKKYKDNKAKVNDQDMRRFY
jgi:hypothetical protein